MWHKLDPIFQKAAASPLPYCADFKNFPLFLVAYTKHIYLGPQDLLCSFSFKALKNYHYHGFPKQHKCIASVLILVIFVLLWQNT